MTKFHGIVIVLIAFAVVEGCNVGMQPAGPDVNEIKKVEAALPPDQQIKMIQTSPMPAATKQQKIAEIEQKYGIKATPPAPGSATP